MVASIGNLSRQHAQTIRLFLCGDVMLGRGIDQVLAHPCDPMLHEDYAHSALDYVRLAEEANGPIERPVAPTYIWGAALEELEASLPYVKGSKVVATDEQGDPLYEDIGPTPRFLALSRRYLQELCAQQDGAQH